MDHGPERDGSNNAYRLARQVSAILLIAVITIGVLLDSFRGNSPSPVIVVPLLIAAAGLLAVDLPGL